MVVGVCVWKWRYGGGITFGCILVSLFSSVPFFEYWPSIKGVGMGFYDLWSQSSRYSPCAGFAEKPPRVILIGSRTYGFVRLCMWNGCLIASFPFLSFPTIVWGYAAQDVCT